MSLNFGVGKPCDRSSRAFAGLWASDIIGGIIWGIGLGVEATADQQKFNFKMNPANKGKFINVGAPLNHIWRHAYPFIASWKTPSRKQENCLPENSTPHVLCFSVACTKPASGKTPQILLQTLVMNASPELQGGYARVLTPADAQTTVVKGIILILMSSFVRFAESSGLPARALEPLQVPQLLWGVLRLDRHLADVHSVVPGRLLGGYHQPHLRRGPNHGPERHPAARKAAAGALGQ